MKRESLHILVTRYNTCLIGKEGFDYHTWFDRRIKVFNEICVPSINNQTFKDFTWVIFIDPLTPIEHREMIAENISSDVRYEFSQGVTGMEYFETIGQGKRLSTSRLDNDDGLRYDFMEFVNERMESNTERTVLNFQSGYQYNYKNSKYYDYTYKKGSNVLTVLDYNEQIMGVWDREHPGMCEGMQYKGSRVNVETIKDKFWIQSINGLNFRNTVRGKLTKDPDRNCFSLIQ
jgi:hypothetical protein